MFFKAKIFVKIILSAFLTEFHSLRNMKKLNFSKKTLFLALLPRDSHGIRSLAFLVKVDNK